MKSEAITLFSVNVECEERFTVSPNVIQQALDAGILKIQDAVEIEQIWFGKDKCYTARIRKTRNLIDKNSKTTYTHTVKHHVSDKADYEVTTNIGADYKTLRELYAHRGVQSKIRFYVTDTAGEYSDYIVTVDYPKDKPEECWVEFELKNPINQKEFKKPSWLKEKN